MSHDTPWHAMPLEKLTPEQWEALCDRCGRCCLIKLIDEDDRGETLHYTNVACRLLDCRSGSCSDYANRKRKVPECIVLTPQNLSEQVVHLPPTCAYRLRYEGKPLADWHPLISGRAESVAEAGISVGGRVISERQVRDSDLEGHIWDWVS